MTPIWLIHGEDTFSAHEQVVGVLTGLDTRRGDPSLVELEGARLTEGELASALNVLPMFAARQVVLVRDLCRRFEAGGPARPGKKARVGKPAGDWPDFLARLPNEMSPIASVVFWESGPIKPGNPLLKALVEFAQVTEHRPKKGAELAAWLRSRAAQLGTSLTRAAVEELVGLGTSDLHQLSADLEKLSLFAGAGRAIDEDDVRTLCLPAEQERIWDLVDAVSRRDAAAALYCLRQVCPEENAGHRVLPILVGRFRQLLQARELLDGGSQKSQLGRRLGVTDWQAGKLANQASNFSVVQLTRLYQRLLEIDHAAKTGRGEMLLALDLLVTERET